MASARAALGKKKHKQTKKTHKFHCFTLYCGSLSKQAPGHGMWPLGNHGNHWAAPQMQPLSQPGQQSHLPEQSHLKPVLDWALKSSLQVWVRGKVMACTAIVTPLPQTNLEQQKKMCYDNFINLA